MAATLRHNGEACLVAAAVAEALQAQPATPSGAAVGVAGSFSRNSVDIRFADEYPS